MRFPLNETDYQGAVRFTPEDGAVRKGFLQKGAQQIELYMPTSLQFGDKVEYENVGLTGLGATTVDAVRSAGSETKSKGAIQSFADAMSNDNAADLMTVGVTQLVSSFSDKAGAVARESFRVAPNPNTRAIFKQVSLRQFQMTFKLIPNSEREAEEIGSIITEFRTNMYPEEIEGNFGYRFPTRYKIEALYDGHVLDEYHIMTEPCYLESVMTNYNPSSHAFMKSGSSKKGFFSEIDLSLTFIEGKTLNRKSIEAGF